VQAVIPQFADEAEFQIRFQPFQLYPDLPKGDNEGVDKIKYFEQLRTMRNGGVAPDPEVVEERGRRLRAAWKNDGLTLAPKGGRWGQSFDAQRLISLARKQGREDAMVEEIYSGNHEQNQPLSEWSFLIAAAGRAGVTGAEELLHGDQEADEVRAKIRKHIEMGINAVPVIVINDRTPIHGAPDHQVLADAFAAEIMKAQ
jgi:predicted DsbA family dithiol-disulfide isomerase